MKQRYIWAAVGCLAAPATAMAADDEGNFAIKGIGATNCAIYLEEREQQSNTYYRFGGWIEGYMSAANELTPDTYDIIPWQSTELLTALIANHCQDNRDQNFLAVVRAMAAALHDDRLVRRSDWTEIPAGDQSLRIYTEIIRRMQQQLAARGHYDGAIDGSFGPATRAALEDYQRAAGIEVSGLPSQLTLLNLFAPGAND